MVDCAEATAAGVPATGDERDELVDEEELKRLHGASRTKNICRELLRAALIAKRPSTTPHPVYDLLDELVAAPTAAHDHQRAVLIGKPLSERRDQPQRHDDFLGAQLQGV